MTDPQFAARPDEETVESGTILSPRFDRDGLVVAIATDADDGAVLMVAHMDATALARTIATGEAWFYSRSRKRLWRKGEESGNTLSVSEVRVDCDQDAILLKVRVAGDGVACHRGFRSCFYRSVPIGAEPNQGTMLSLDRAMRRKDSADPVAKGRPDR
jgi:phosphoribosyl-AMP cyclohydrolase